MEATAVQSEFLSAAELRELTDYARGEDQQRVLGEQGIPFKVVGRRVIVLRRHVVAWMENRPVRQSAGPALELVK